MLFFVQGRLWDVSGILPGWPALCCVRRYWSVPDCNRQLQSSLSDLGCPQGRLGNPQTGCQFGRVVDFALRAFRASSEAASIQSRNLAGAMLKTRLPAMAFLTWPAQFSSASITGCRAAAILALDSRGRDETVAIESLGHQLLDLWRTAVRLVRQLFRERPLGHIRLVEETLS